MMIRDSKIKKNHFGLSKKSLPSATSKTFLSGRRGVRLKAELGRTPAPGRKLLAPAGAISCQLHQWTNGFSVFHPKWKHMKTESFFMIWWGWITGCMIFMIGWQLEHQQKLEFEQQKYGSCSCFFHQGKCGIMKKCRFGLTSRNAI